jgi:hypothetical protein
MSDTTASVDLNVEFYCPLCEVRVRKPLDWLMERGRRCPCCATKIDLDAILKGSKPPEEE